MEQHYPRTDALSTPRLYLAVALGLSCLLVIPPFTFPSVAADQNKNSKWCLVQAADKDGVDGTSSNSELRRAGLVCREEYETSCRIAPKSALKYPWPWTTFGTRSPPNSPPSSPTLWRLFTADPQAGPAARQGARLAAGRQQGLHTDANRAGLGQGYGVGAAGMSPRGARGTVPLASGGMVGFPPLGPGIVLLNAFDAPSSRFKGIGHVHGDPHFGFGTCSRG